MRPPFTDSKRLKARARDLAKEGSLERWWAKKYKLPTDHPLLQDRSPGGLLFELYRDWADELEAVEEQLKTMTGKDKVILVERHRELTKLLDAPEVVDDWEEMMRRGERPDLSKYAKPRKGLRMVSLEDIER